MKLLALNVPSYLTKTCIPATLGVYISEFLSVNGCEGVEAGMNQHIVCSFNLIAIRNFINYLLRGASNFNKFIRPEINKAT